MKHRHTLSPLYGDRPYWRPLSIFPCTDSSQTRERALHCGFQDKSLYLLNLECKPGLDDLPSQQAVRREGGGDRADGAAGGGGAGEGSGDWA